MNEEQAKKLREEFPASQIGKLPKGNTCQCGRPAIARSLCHAHYRRWRTKGDPQFDVALAHTRKSGDRTNIGARLVARSVLGERRSDGTRCMTWTGAHNPKGYGSIRRGQETLAVHRAAFEHWVGPIPEGLDIDHLCHNRACINPVHLEPVTHAENVRRRR